MRLSATIASLLCCWGAHTFGLITTHTVSYSKSGSVYAIRMSQDDVVSFVHKVSTILDSINQEVGSDTGRITISFKGDNSSLELTTPLDWTLLSKAPSVTTRMIIMYASGKSNAPVTSVELFCADVQRTIEVKGTSVEHVDSVYAMLVDSIDPYTTYAGGQTFRILAAAAVYFLLLIVQMVVIFTLKTAYGSPIIACSFGALVPLSMCLPFDAWLPGTAIYSGDASWLVRHSALFTFLGFAVSLLAVVYPAVQYIVRNGSKTPQEQAQTQDVTQN